MLASKPQAVNESRTRVSSLKPADLFGVHGVATIGLSVWSYSSRQSSGSRLSPYFLIGSLRPAQILVCVSLWRKVGGFWET